MLKILKLNWFVNEQNLKIYLQKFTLMYFYLFFMVYKTRSLQLIRDNSSIVHIGAWHVLFSSI